MEMKTGLLEAEEGRWDITNKLCELQGHKCLCAAPAGMLEQSKELVQAVSTCSSVLRGKGVFSEWAKHPHECVLGRCWPGRLGQTLQGRQSFQLKQ